MSLSNTATPIYYGKFREQVRRGEIPVCQEIELEMNRIDALIADPDIYYDDQAINGFIAFCEAELTLTDGEPLKLLETFKLWAEQIFAWKIYVQKRVWKKPTPIFRGGYFHETVEKRLTTMQYLIVARGAAKSMYAACLQSYFLTIDTDTTQQITTAPTMKQAEEVLAPIRTAISRHPGPLFDFLTQGSLQNTTGNRADRQKLAATKRGIENFLTGSHIEIRPMALHKLQGLRCKVATVDEWLSGDLRENVIGALEQGARKGGLDDYLIVAISSEGTVRNGPGDTIKMELADILKGTFYQPHISIFHYKLDDEKEVNDPAMWVKAQPNLDFTVTYETYIQDVERAEKVPSQKNDILAKRFGIPSEGYTYYFTFDEIQPFKPTHPNRFHGMSCAMGADLSRGDDFCAFTFLFPLADGTFGVKTRSYITDLTLRQLPAAMRFKYEEFRAEGTLIVIDTTVLDMMDVYDDLDAFIGSMEYLVEALGFDPYNAKEFIDRYAMENGTSGIEKVQQGSRTESVPLGELKKLAEQRMLIFDEILMSFTMGNAITLQDTNGNRKLYKRAHEEKIDNVAALMDAWIAFKLNKEAFS